MPFADQRGHLERQISQLERQAARLGRDFRARLAAGERANELAYWELVGSIREEVGQLRARLAASGRHDGRTALPEGRDGKLGAAFVHLLSGDVPQEEEHRLVRAFSFTRNVVLGRVSVTSPSI